MKLYHGSYIKVNNIDLEQCLPGLDFGKGFYVTSSRQQAVKFVPNAVKKAIAKGKIDKDFKVDNGQISAYEYIANRELKILEFSDADAEWLHFVAAHRNGKLFPELVEKYADYDIIIGKIADDQTSMVLVAYVTGAYGVPGTTMADETAVRFLLPNNLKDQYCFRTNNAISCLRFVKSESYGKVKSNR